MTRGVSANCFTAEDNNQKYMVFEGLGYGEGDEEGGSAHDESFVEAFEDDSVSHR
jgi:hypothetical protein